MFPGVVQTCNRILFFAALLLSTLPVVCAVPAQSQTASGDNDRTYRQMLDKALVNPAGADWVMLRRAYAASAAYDPLAGDSGSDNGLTDAIRRRDGLAVIAITQATTTRNTMDLRAQLFAEAANRQLGRIATADFHGAIAKGILDAIRKTGDGATQQTAYQVLTVMEEYILLDQLDLRSAGQALITANGHVYDRLSAVGLSGGGQRDVFFNIDVLFAREAAVRSGAVTPVPQDSLPR